MTGPDRAEAWVLLGPHKGDNDQVLALANALGVPFHAIQLRYRWFAHLPAVARRAWVAQLTPETRMRIKPPWPSLVLGIGQRSAPVARFIKQASGGYSKTVRLGDPMVSHKLFDLVITTTQYAVRDGDNVVRLPVTVTSPRDVVLDDRERQWLQRFPHPRRLIVIGGKTSLWRFDRNVLTDAIQILQRKSAAHGGSVIAVTSPRTGRSLTAAARAALGSDALVESGFPRYAALLQAADEIHVTGDSVSMLSDAVATGKPVGLIPLKPDAAATFVRLTGQLRGRPFRVRNLEKFWNDLRIRGLVGTVECPRAGRLDISPIKVAVDAVQAVLDCEKSLRPMPVSSLLVATPRPLPL
jgi:mitochondrial fission protein ELM1